MKLEFTMHNVHIADMLGIICFRLHILHCSPTCELFENQQLVDETNNIVKTLLQYDWEFNVDYACQLLHKIYNLGEALMNECSPDMDSEYPNYYGIDYPAMYALGEKIVNEIKDLL